MKQTMPKKRTYLWQYSRPGGAVVFDFRMGREREGPKRFLASRHDLDVEESSERRPIGLYQEVIANF
jgi:hypothetical protein